MTTEPPQNPYFRPPPESKLGDEEVCSHVRAEFYDIRSRFLNRLACAQVFDRERFEALLLWLDTLRRCCAVAGSPMAASDLDQFDTIAGYLEQEATYSRNQRAECAEAHARWLGIMDQFRVLPEAGR
jgi:hypothetical protein